jgi:hypothetical protein
MAYLGCRLNGSLYKYMIEYLHGKVRILPVTGRRTKREQEMLFKEVTVYNGRAVEEYLARRNDQ